MSLNTAIEDAGKTLQVTLDEKAAADSKEVKEVKASAKVETPEEEVETDENSEEQLGEVEVETDELSEEELLNAKSLFKGLKNPNTAKAIVTALASQAGILTNSSGTAVSEKKVENVASTIVDTFRESLGEEYAFLADKLAPAVEKLVEQIAEKQLESVKATLAKQEEAKLQETTGAALTSVINEFKVPTEVQKEMYKLMDTVLPSPSQKPEVYFKTLYHAAKFNVDHAASKASTQQKVARNRDDAASHLASNGKAKTSAPAVTAPSKMTLNQAIAKAMEELKQ